MTITIQTEEERRRRNKTDGNNRQHTTPMPTALGCISRIVLLCLTSLLLVLCLAPLTITSAQRISQNPLITKVELLVGGSVLTEPYLRRATLAYQLVSPNVTIKATYDVSSLTQPLVLSGAYDLGMFASSYSLTAAQKKANPDILQMPFIGVAAVPVYNIPSIPAGSDPIRFTRSVLSRIVRANITRWDDPALVALNPFLADVPYNITFVAGLKWTQSVADVYGRWLCKSDPILLKMIGCDLDTWNPTKIPYARFIGVTLTSQTVTNVALIPNSLGFSTIIFAKNGGLDIANLVTDAGATIEPTTISTQLPIYERGLDMDSLGNTDLTTATGPNAWPMVQFQFLQFSSTFVRKDCQTRVELAKFITWMLNDDVSQALATQVSQVIIPSLVSDNLGIPTLLTESLQCNGIAALPATSLTTGVMHGTKVVEAFAPYVLEFYATIDTEVPYSFKETSYEESALLLIGGQTDVLLQMSREDTSLLDFVILPMFAAVPQPIFHLPTSVTSVSGVLPLTIDLDTLAAIFSGQVSSWLDPRILQFNPALGTAIRAANMTPTLNVIVCCTNSDPLAATNLFVGALRPSSVLDGSPLHQLPVAFNTVFNPTATNVSYIFASEEVDLAALNAVNVGSISYRISTSGTVDDSTTFRVIPWTGESSSASIHAAEGSVAAYSSTVAATPSAALNCFRGPLSTDDSPAMFRFSSGALDMNLPGSVPTDCYPLTRVINLIIPSSYTGVTCDRGNHTLNLISWMANTPAIAAAALGSGLAVVTDIPDVYTAFITRLNQITCDGSTMLVRQAKVWEMNSSLSALGIALSCIGLVICCLTGVLLYFLRDRSVFRSASVLFLFLTLVGIMMMLISALLWSIKTPTDAICRGFTVTTQIGFTLTFMPLFIKTWRIWYIFERRQLKVSKLTNSKLSVVVASFVIFDAIVLIAWDAEYPIRAILEETDSNGTLRHYTHCSPPSDAMVYFWILMFSKIISLLFGACIGFATRNVNQQFNESKNVAMSIWNVFFTIIVLVPIMILLDTLGDALIGLVLFLLIWVCVGTYFFMFVNKFLSLQEWREWNQTTSAAVGLLAGNNATGGAATGQQSITVSEDGFSFMSIHTLGTETLVRYIAECERHMAQAKRIFLKLGGASGLLQTLHYLEPVRAVEPHKLPSAVHDDAHAPVAHAAAVGAASAAAGVVTGGGASARLGVLPRPASADERYEHSATVSAMRHDETIDDHHLQVHHHYTPGTHQTTSRRTNGQTKENHNNNHNAAQANKKTNTNK